MKNILMAILIGLNSILLASCAASAAATEEQHNTPLKATEKPVAPPVNNGSATAAKMIAPLTGY